MPWFAASLDWLRTGLSAWLDKHLRIFRSLDIADSSLLVSSDPIESLFGKFKTIVQRNPHAELNRLLFVIPLLCGHHSPERRRRKGFRRSVAVAIRDKRDLTARHRAGTEIQHAVTERSETSGWIQEREPRFMLGSSLRQVVFGCEEQLGRFMVSPISIPIRRQDR